MNAQDFKLNCSECGRKVGILTLIGGSMVNVIPKVCCLACLPKRLDNLEKDNYNPEAIKSAREWILQP